MNEVNLPSRLVLMILIALVTAKGSVAQEYSYRHYTVRDGLPQNQVMSLFQDSKGYLWIGTKGGVSRFDGHSFKNFTVKNGLQANYVGSVMEDEKGRILFYTHLGLDRLEQDTIRNVFLSDTIYPDKKLFFVDTGSHTKWWILDRHRLYIHDGYGPADTFDLPEALRDKSLVKIVHEEAFDKLWFLTEKSGFYCFSVEGWRHYDFPPKARIVKFRQGDLAVLDSTLLYTIDTISHRLDTLAMLGSVNLANPERGRDGIIYFSSDVDYVGMAEGAEVTRLARKFNYINSILVDREGILWIGTETGLYKRISTAFENYSPETGAPEYVWSMVQDKKGTYWFATYGDGLYRMQNGVFKRSWDFVPAYRILGGDFFYTGANCFSDNALYFPVRGSGILRLKDGRFSLLEGVPPGSAMDILEDTVNDQFVIASTQGVLVWKEGGVVRSLLGKYMDSRKYVKALAMDKYGRYWLGGEYLLFIYDKGELVPVPNDTLSYNAGAVAIHLDHRQNVWLGTTSGLYFYDYDKFQKISPGRINRQVSSFAESDRGMLHMGVSEGLAVLDLDAFYTRDTLLLEILSAAEGFLGFDCIRNGILLDQDNNLWVAASDRVVKFYPDRYLPDTIDPVVRIEHLQAEGNGQQHLVKPMEDDGENLYAWPFNVNNVRIDFHSAHFNKPENISFKYRLAGYTPNWSERTRDRSVVYANLAPGDYTFEVVAQNADGHWSRKPAAVHFTIRPAFWQTLTYKIAVNTLAALLILFTGYVVLGYFRRRKEAREKTERQISELQLKTIRSQMDPHFTFNALNTISSVIYKEDKEKAYRYFTKFSRLVRSSLEVSDKISRTLEEEMEFTVDYLDLEKIRFKDDFKFTVHIDPGVNMQWPVPKMIVQNYVENAVKHGLKHKTNNRLLEIRITSSNNMLFVTIEDNGVGRTAAAKKKSHSTGKGLKIMESIYELYYRLYKIRIIHKIEDLTDEKGKPAGTRVQIEVPGNHP